MNFSRDGAVWWVGIVGALLVFFSDQFGLLQAAFPGIDPVWAARIKFASALIGIVSGYLRMSPLPLSPTSELAGKGADPNQSLTLIGDAKEKK